MDVLVTGGTGFIGRYLVDHLTNHGYHVKVLTRRPSVSLQNAEAFQGDITKPDTLLAPLDGVEAVFHNAAYALDWGKKNLIYKVNIQGTINVAEACKKAGVNRIIYTGSAGVYGFPNTSEEITEDSLKKPLNTYQKSKLEAEKALEQFTDLHTSTIRPPLVLGGGGNAADIILSRINQQTMVYVGKGDQCISLVHPEDVAQCLRLALEHDKNGDSYNVVSFRCKIRELFEEVARKMGVDPPRKHISYFLAYSAAIIRELFATQPPSLTRFRVKSLGTTRKISCDKAIKELGYKPIHDLSSTVDDIVTWYKERSNQ
jgi:nucleoside-diphosphate-sugar epimerase